MEDIADNTLSMQVLACITALPQHTARTYMNLLHPKDFHSPLYGRIFEALTNITMPDTPSPSAVASQVNAWLLEQGDYKNQDTGIRHLVAELTGQQICTALLPLLAKELVEAAYRRAIATYGEALTERAHSSPLADVAATIDKVAKAKGLLTERLTAFKLAGVEQVAA
ncbi:hypothetical protein CIP107577_01958 [Corynebacterium diphtheriae]|nr:hypothetical protein CIP107577_01958 [Corynebacterium diphtheriae]